MVIYLYNNFNRALLDAKKQRLCRHLSSTSTSSSTTTTTTVALTAPSLQDQVHNSTTVGDQSSSPPLPSSSPNALEVNTATHLI